MASTAPKTPRAKRTAPLAKTDAAPKPKAVRRKTSRADRAAVTQATLRSMNPKGNTVLKDFGRILRDEPHKYIYPIKLYLKRDMVPAEDVMRWLRERYIEAKGHVHHGARYEARTYGTAKNADGTPGPRYVDYILLEKMTDDERVMFTLEFGDVTDQKIVRDGKLRRPRLNKEEKKALDDVINQYYLDIARKRREAVDDLAERRSAEA
jgi:hypothetical protein